MKNITINDIARISGYSKKTVSRVINNEKSVKSSTREAIQEIIDEYNFKPNINAKNLNSKESKNFLVSIRKSKSAINEWINLLLIDLVNEAKKEGYHLIVEDYYFAKDFQNSIISSYSNFIDGVIIFYEEKNDERIEILNTLNIPFVVFGMSYNTSVSFVANDNYTSCKSAAHELIRSGINSCHILIANKIPTNIERKNGVIDAFSEAGLDNIKVFYDITCASDAYALVSSDISNHRLPDLYFVSGDDKAIGVIKALNDGNIKIPERTSVIGYDDIPSSEFLSPSLSTIRPDYIELARCLVVHLVRQITGNRNTSNSIIRSTIIWRDSTPKIL